ncbi:MAG: orotidine 5'-phosphate decarboxylase [Chloroflexi bacterium RBG_16_57_8]|nr:MAG: orotidine 5'-phosphate decarboxylase [Chloroflexi bacterium RBG_16_57_8]
MNFLERLAAAVHKNRSLVCVGLDPDPALMPVEIGVADFNRAIIDATSDLVCAYKPNLAFYEALGDEGMAALKATLKHIPNHIPVIADAKRSDIGNTAKAYARALFDYFGFDASTINAYLGYDSVEPFIQYSDKAIFILCRTSNPGAADFQSLRCETPTGLRPLFEIVADKANEWNKSGNIGLVVGATYPEELKQVRQRHPDLPFLVPGVGAQGGDLELTVRHGADSRRERTVINSSRQIIYASRGKDFAAAARKAAQTLRAQINGVLAELE